MDIEKIKKNFEKNGYTVSYFENAEKAADYLNDAIDNQYVGFGDSETLYAMGLYDKLSTHNRVVDPQHRVDGKNFKQTAKECLTTDIFLTSVNGATENGEMINIDGTGNRIAGSLFGHKKVYFVFGINKLEPTLEKALWRARNIAAPLNAQRHKLHTPCAEKADHCYNCSSPERICNGIIVYHKKMNYIKMEIIIIGEKMGF